MENNKAKYCKNCWETKQSYGNMFSGCYGTNLLIPENNRCLFCGYDLTEMPITIDELRILDNISKDISFLEAMIELKEKDIIEFESRMGQFRNQIAQQEQIKQQASTQVSTPKCPICQSTNLSKISAAKKATKIGLFGIFGAGDVGKTWKCNNCGSKF